MRLSSYLISVSIVSLAGALTPYDSDCGYPRNVGFNSTNADLFIRCAETTYFCNSTLHGGKEWFSINSTNEAVPADCEKDVYLLVPYAYRGPILMPGLTELLEFRVRGDYSGSKGDGDFVLIPANVTVIDLPDLVNITDGNFIVDNADSIPSLSVPKLRYIYKNLDLNFTGGPAINLTFPSLTDVHGGIYLDGEIDALDFPVLNYTEAAIMVNSTGNLDCNAFAASVFNSTRIRSDAVLCTSKNGSVTLNHVAPPEVTSGAFKIRGDSLALTGLLAYMLAQY